MKTTSQQSTLSTTNPQEYLATVSSAPTQQQLAALRAGAAVEGVMCVPKLVKVVSGGGDGQGQQQQQQQQRGASNSSSNSSSSSSGRSSGAGGGSGRGGGGGGAVVRVVVSEGKKHEVRILVAAAGLQLVSLHRTRIGGYMMPADLAPGGYT
jgi:pseudouridine synthase